MQDVMTLTSQGLTLHVEYTEASTPHGIPTIDAVTFESSDGNEQDIPVSQLRASVIADIHAAFQPDGI